MRRAHAPRMQVMLFYYSSPRVRRGLVYGPSARNHADLYLPDGAASGADPSADKRPVVVFVTGGMWIIGYKAWGALLAQRLMERGIIVAALDYRNFPQGTVSDMVEDVAAGIGWALDTCGEWGGDASRLTVVGQSAGAHLAALALLRQAELCAAHAEAGGKLASGAAGGVSVAAAAATRETGGPGGSHARGSSVGCAPLWQAQCVSAFLGVSGVYEPDNPALVRLALGLALRRPRPSGTTWYRGTVSSPTSAPGGALPPQGPVPRSHVGHHGGWLHRPTGGGGAASRLAGGRRSLACLRLQRCCARPAPRMAAVPRHRRRLRALQPVRRLRGGAAPGWRAHGGGAAARSRLGASSF